MKDLLKILVFTAALVVGFFTWSTGKMTTVVAVHPNAVDQHFRTALASFDDPTPMRARAADGRILHLRLRDQRLVPAAPSDVVILAWRGREQGLVETRVPIWLLGLSETLRDWMLRESRFDPAEWSLTVAEIQAAGLGVLVDDVDRRGMRTLVWAE